MSAAATRRPAPVNLPARALSTLLALGYATLFVAGLYFVTGFHESPAYPAPGAAISQIVAYFEHNADDVRTSIFLSFAAELLLGAFVAVSVVRLRVLAPRRPLVEVVLVTGVAVAFLQMTSHLAEWTATFPGLGQPGILTAYYLSYGLGGPAFSLTMGLFVGLLAAAGWRAGALPGWVVWSGAVIACIGLVSWGNLLVPEARFLTLLIPLTRFPSLAWLIAAGATLQAPAFEASAAPAGQAQAPALRE
jgi:hypothetical protein